MLYRIYTENKNAFELEKLLKSEFQSFTVFDGRGCWQGDTEQALIIEIMGDSYLDHAITRLASTIAKLNQQACVIVQRIDCTIKTVSNPDAQDYRQENAQLHS